MAVCGEAGGLASPAVVLPVAVFFVNTTICFWPLLIPFFGVTVSKIGRSEAPANTDLKFWMWMNYMVGEGQITGSELDPRLIAVYAFEYLGTLMVCRVWVPSGPAIGTFIQRMLAKSVCKNYNKKTPVSI